MRPLRKVWSVIDLGTGDISNAIVVLDHQLQGEARNREVKIGSFTKGSSPTIPGKINGNCVAITIDTGAEVSILRRGLLRAKDLGTVRKTIRLNTVTGESTPIVGKAEVEICIGHLKDDFILGMDLINCHGLTVDPPEKFLRLGNVEFILNQHGIESKPVRLIACQNVKVRGNAETIVPVRAEVKPGFVLDIIQLPHTPKKYLMIASTLINTDCDIPVRANVFPKPMNIKSGEVLAVSEQVTKILLVTVEGIKRKLEIPALII